jgi:hypothetical protein
VEVFLEVLKQYGMQSALVAYFLWRDSVREKETVKRIRDLEEYITGALVGLVQNTTQTINKANNAVKSVADLLAARPCLKDDREVIKDILEADG